MNKSHLNPGINNYLVTSSLFKSSQKNRLVSSYVSHRNYFAEQETPKRHKELYIPNLTKSKKQQRFVSNDNSQERIIQQSKNDALSVTVKREGKVEPFLQEKNNKSNMEAQMSKMEAQLPTIKQDHEEVIPNEHQKQKDSIMNSQKLRQSEIQKERLKEERERQELQRQKEMERQRQRERERQELQRQKEMQIYRQRERQRQADYQRLLYLKWERQKQMQMERQRLEEERRRQRQRLLQQQNLNKYLMQADQSNSSKIVAYYNSKGKGRKLKDREMEGYESLYRQNQVQQNQYNYKYMQYNREEDQQIQANPYLPTTEKKPKQTRKEPAQNPSLKKSNSIRSAASEVQQIPNQTPKSKKSAGRKNQPPLSNEETDYFVKIRKDMKGYLESIKQKLNNSYICLQTVQYDYESQIERALNSECQKLKSILYGFIDEEINSFKQFQKRQFLKSKFYFMSDLYQIKCNIDLRLQQIEHYELQLKNQYKWKDFANSILGINYNQNINFILKKSDEIQNQLTNSVNPQITHYSKSINEEFVSHVRDAIKQEFNKVYEHFKDSRFTSLGARERQ